MTDDPDEALFFAKIDQDTIRVVIRDKSAGQRDFSGTGSTGKVYTLKREARVISSAKEKSQMLWIVILWLAFSFVVAAGARNRGRSGFLCFLSASWSILSLLVLRSLFSVLGIESSEKVARRPMHNAHKK